MRKTKLILSFLGLFLISGVMFYMTDGFVSADDDAEVKVELTTTDAYQFRMTGLDLNDYSVSITGYTCNASSCAISGSIDDTGFVVKDFSGVNEWRLTLKAADLTNDNGNVIKSGNILIKMDNLSNYTGSSHCYSTSSPLTTSVVVTDVTTTYKAFTGSDFDLFARDDFDGTASAITYGDNASGTQLTVTGSLCKFAIKKSGTNNGLRIGLKIDAGTPAGQYSGDITITDTATPDLFTPNASLSY